jgi:hypothetical protein
MAVLSKRFERGGKMNEDTLNQEIRRFLKKVGVTSQREIEKAVREGIESGSLTGTERLQARITLEVSHLDLRHTIEETINLE